MKDLINAIPNMLEVIERLYRNFGSQDERKGLHYKKSLTGSREFIYASLISSKKIRSIKFAKISWYEQKLGKCINRKVCIGCILSSLLFKPYKVRFRKIEAREVKELLAIS